MSDSLLASVWWLPLYGLTGALLTLPWAAAVVRHSGPRPAAYFNLLMTLAAFLHCLWLIGPAWEQPSRTLSLPWLQVLDLALSLDIEVSRTSILSVTIITGLSLLAQVFALGYMEKDWGLARFFSLMGFFEGAMCGLALSNSLLLSYGLLEVLTLSTYLLVGFWYAQPLVVTAARDAFLTKRVGDLLLLMGVIALASLAPSLNFDQLALWAETADLWPPVAVLLTLALIAGPVGKCAQIPLHFWLDEAMEGPNPASIMRNSVVVATGAYVLIKLQPVLALSPVALGALVVIGTLTAVAASSIALAQIDIKRSLSYSTSAHLGLVFIAVGLRQNEAALLLLATHALAKALLFMSTGSLILVTTTQNLNEMGGLARRLPATTTAYLVGAAASVALLPLGSFWAMLAAGESFWSISPWPVWVLVLVNGLAALNLARVFTLAFLGTAHAKSRRAPEVSWQMAVPMITLSVVNLLAPLLLWHLGGLVPEQPTAPIWVVAGCLTASALVGVYLGFILVRRGRKFFETVLPERLQRPVVSLQHFLANDFYIERLYRQTIVRWVASTAALTSHFDRHGIDGAVNLVGGLALLTGEALRRSNPGRAQFYLLTILLGVMVVCAFELMSFIR